LRAVSEKFSVALYGEGNEDLGFLFWCREVEGYTIEVGGNLINRDWRGSILSSKAVPSKRGHELPGEAFCKEGLNQDILIVEEEHVVKTPKASAAS